MSVNGNLLIVDDVAENIQVAMNILREDGYDFTYATSGQKALEILEHRGSKIDLILLDIMMPEMSGFEVCARIKNESLWANIPIIFVTARSDIESITKGFELGGFDYVTKPFHSSELIARVRTHVQLFKAQKALQAQNIHLERKTNYVEERFLTELENSQKELILILIELMEYTSDETGKHIRRIAEASALFAQLHPALNDADAEILFHASPMHDVGKITVPHEILHKPGKYTSEEFEIMKAHTANAFNLLKNSKRRLVRASATIAHEHHEKWDGSGYPRGLKGDDIHLYGRIVALADVLDALTHKRCYKEAWSLDQALEYIKEQRGKHFDPELVDILNDNVGHFKQLLQIN